MFMLAKTTTYCIMHFAVAFGVAYAITGDFAVATAISLIEPIVQTFFYFFHELAWQGRFQKAFPVRAHAHSCLLPRYCRQGSER